MSTEFPSNSKRPREDPKKVVESVIINKAVPKKKPLGQRMKSLFFAGDSRSAAQSVIMDVILPQIKDMVAEAAQQAVERMIFGESRTSGRRSGYYRSGGTSTTHTNYGNRYSGRGNNPIGRASREERTPNASLRHEEVEDILLASRAEAQEVLERLGDLIESYERATVADLKALIDWSPEITDERWGWESLEGARVLADRQGFVLDLPKPQPLD